jgi:hypothetical protein
MKKREGVSGNTRLRAALRAQTGIMRAGAKLIQILIPLPPWTIKGAKKVGRDRTPKDFFPDPGKELLPPPKLTGFPE